MGISTFARRHSGREKRPLTANQAGFAEGLRFGISFLSKTPPRFCLNLINRPYPSYRIRRGLDKVGVLEKGRRGSPSESPPQRSRPRFLLFAKAKGMGEEVRGRLSGHGFSMEASLLICSSKAAGVPRGMALLVAGRSPRRGGRERSERWKGESAAFSLQRDDVGNERADEPMPEPFICIGTGDSLQSMFLLACRQTDCVLAPREERRPV
jgi:hypothetical protein